MDIFKFSIFPKQIDSSKKKILTEFGGLNQTAASKSSLSSEFCVVLPYQNRANVKRVQKLVTETWPLGSGTSSNPRYPRKKFNIFDGILGHKATHRQVKRTFLVKQSSIPLRHKGSELSVQRASCKLIARTCSSTTKKPIKVKTRRLFKFHEKYSLTKCWKFAIPFFY